MVSHACMPRSLASSTQAVTLRNLGVFICLCTHFLVYTHHSASRFSWSTFALIASLSHASALSLSLSLYQFTRIPSLCLFLLTPYMRVLSLMSFSLYLSLSPSVYTPYSLPSQLPIVLPILLEAMPGRLWDGKESVLEAAAQVAVQCHEVSSFCTKITSVGEVE